MGMNILLANKFLHKLLGDNYHETGGLIQFKKWTPDVLGSGSEVKSTWALPAKCVVLEVFADVRVAEATASSELVDIGTDAGSDDPDGFLDGIDTSTTGLKSGGGVITEGSNEHYLSGATLGALLREYQEGADVAGNTGYLKKKWDYTSGGSVLSITPVGADFDDLVIDVYIVYIDITNFSPSVIAVV